MRRPDAIGVALLAGFAVAMIGGGGALLASGLVKPWELTAVLGLGSVLVAAALPRAPASTPRNTHVHGAARPAVEAEAQDAARGNSKTASIRPPRAPGR